MRSTLSGFFLPFSRLGLIMRPGLRRFVVVPLLLNLIVFAALAYIAGTYFDSFMDRWLPSQSWLEFLRWLLWALFAIVYAVAVFYGFTLIANLIAAPFNGILAARVERELTGTMPAGGEVPLWKTVGPALSGEVGKIVYFLVRAVPLLILLLIPGVNVVAGVLWVVFGFWFLAIEYADYPMGNHDIAPAAQRQHLRTRRLKSLAFGAGVTAMMLVPGLQFAAMPAAVAGATRLWVDDLEPKRRAV